MMQRSDNSKSRWIGAAMLVCIVAGVLGVYMQFSGRPQRIATEYGQRGGSGYYSVNGTSVLAKMFAQAGHYVSTWRMLSPRLDRSDTIIWTPNSFEAPADDVTEYFEEYWLPGNLDWFDAGSVRTLIIIGRSYDASADYWRQAANQRQGTDRIDAWREAAHARAEQAYARSLTDSPQKCDWFSVERLAQSQSVTAYDGEWADIIDADRAALRVSERLSSEPDEDTQTEVLLGCEQSPLILRITNSVRWPDGQIIVVSNGSSLLNMPLVNHENRKLAAKLIDACGPAGRVTFLESGPQGLRISHSDPQAVTSWQILQTWPINCIVLHLILLGILYCFMVFPIFGRPRELASDGVSDFGRHVTALGELLMRNADEETAKQMVIQYRQQQGDSPSGRPHPTPTGNPFGSNFTPSSTSNEG